jgi:hypothetical protein
MVTTMTRIGLGTRGPASARVTSMPSSRGIRMSTRQTSGRSWRAWAIASTPSDASAMTLMSGWSSRMSFRPLRIIAWSSASSTRIVIVTVHR